MHREPLRIVHSQALCKRIFSKLKDKLEVLDDEDELTLSGLSITTIKERSLKNHE